MSPIIETKLTPYQFPSRLVLRRRLFDRLSKGIQRKLTMIMAGGGWGKSLLMASFLDQAEHRYVWYNLDRHDSDPLTFLKYLVTGVTRLFPNDEQQLALLFEETDEEIDWRLVVSTLVNSFLFHSPKRILLILDDFHGLVSNPEISEVVLSLLRYSPPNVGFVLISRLKPELPISKFRTSGELTEISMDDLGFTPEEIAEFFKEIYGATLSQAELEFVYEYTDGWPICLRMIGESLSYKPREQIRESLEMMKRSGSPIFSYFQEEMFSGLSDSICSFIKQSAILDQLSVANCNAILEIDTTHEIIQTLLEKAVFLVPVNREATLFRYNHILQDFLYERLTLEYEWEFVKNIHLRAAAYFQNENQWQAAADHYMKAGDFDAAAGCIEDVVRQGITHPMADIMDNWIKRLPEDILAERAAILFAKGWILNLRGSHHQAITYMVKARDVAEARRDTWVFGAAVYFMMYIFSTVRKYQQVEELYTHYHHNLDPNSSHALRCTHRMAIALAAMNRFDEAGRMWEKVQQRIEELPELSVSSGILNEMGAYYFLPLGHFPEAIRHLDKILKRSRQLGLLGQYCNFGVFMALTHHEMGNFSRCDTLLDDIVDLQKRIRNPHLHNLVFSLKTINCFLADRNAPLTDLVSQINDLSYEIQYENWNNCARAMYAYQVNDYNTFYSEAERALENIGQKIDYWRQYLVVGWLAPLFVELNQEEKALALLESLLEKLPATGARYAQARCHLLVASIARVLGDESQVQYHLGRSLTISEEMHYDYLFTSREKQRAYRLLPTALALKRSLTYVKLLISAIRDDDLDSKIMPFLTHEDPELRMIAIEVLTSRRCRQAEKSIARLLKDPDDDVKLIAGISLQKIKAFPPLPIQIHALGRFRLFRDKQEIVEKNWGLKMAKSLFKYLLFHRKTEISFDRIIDEFYPDINFEDARKRLHQAASYLRTALEPGIVAKRESGYLKARERYYQLVLPEESYLDVDAFQDFFHKAEKAELQKDIRHAIVNYQAAKDLYHGDFLEEDLYQNWTAPLRTRYAEMHFKTLQRMGKHYFQLLDYEKAEMVIREALDADQLSEDSWLLLIKCHLAMGDRPKAIKSFQTCRDILKEELSIEPNKPLTALYLSIK